MASVLVRVPVTAAHIAACATVPDVGDGFRSSHPDSKDPIELAIADVTGQSVMCDSDLPDGEMATIGDKLNVLVANLPDKVSGWIDRYYRGQAVEPFEFDLEIESWLVDLVRDARPYLTLREAAVRLGVKPSTLRQQAQHEWNSYPGPSARARRIGVVKLGRDWFVDRVAVEREVARAAGARLDDAIETGEL